MFRLIARALGTRRRSSHRRPAVRHLRCETLELRQLLAITVTSLADAGPGSLRDAISLANTSGETILFDVTGTIVLTGGELQIRHAMTIDGAGQDVTVSGNGMSRVFDVAGGTSANPMIVSIANIMIVGGFVAADDPSSIAGGGIRNSAQLTLGQVTLSGNSAGLGGAVANVGEGQLTGNQLVLQNNSAHFGGGAVYGSPDGQVLLSNAEITQNTAGTTNASAYSTFGGGIYSQGDLSLTDVVISGNSAVHQNPTSGAFGGGISAMGDGAGGLNGYDARLTNVTISDNSAQHGGGLHWNSGSAELVSSEITNNIAAQGGGSFVRGEMRIRQSTISGNSTSLATLMEAAGGGALVGPGGELKLYDSYVNNNSSLNRGGGFYVSALESTIPASLELHQTVVSGNTAGYLGGGLLAGILSRVTADAATIDSNQAARRGGGIYASSFNTSLSSQINIQDSSISSNTAVLEIGGGLLFGTGVNAQVDGSVIEANRAANRGGGIYASNFSSGAGSGLTTALSIEGTVIADNGLTATSGTPLGGGIAAGANVDLTLRQSTLSGNDADISPAARGRGGAGYFSAFGFSQTVTIDHSVVISNQVGGVSGGGFVIGQGTTAEIQDSTIDHNSSAGDGGGIQLVFGGLAVIQRSTISNNTATVDGGAISVFDGSLDIENSTISMNVASNDGGGIWAGFNPTFQDMSIRFSTITGNTSDMDGDLYGYGGGGVSVAPGSVFEVENSIVAGNMDGSGLQPADLADPSGAGIVHFSLIEDVLGHQVASGMNGNLTGVSAQLGDLSFHGGATLAHMPLPGSPVLNMADPSAMLSEDQRGYTRPGPNGVRDMGAIESDGVRPVFVLLDFNGDGLANLDDINALTTAIVQGGPLVPYDLNGDGQVDLDDLDVWLVEAGHENLGAGRVYLPGDANLSGDVDGSDFNIWNSSKFTHNGQWGNGDFNADGSVDGSDFGIWNRYKFLSSDALRSSGTISPSATAAVPWGQTKLAPSRESLATAHTRLSLGVMSPAFQREMDHGALPAAAIAAVQVPPLAMDHRVAVVRGTEDLSVIVFVPTTADQTAGDRVTEFTIAERELPSDVSHFRSRLGTERPRDHGSMNASQPWRTARDEMFAEWPE